MDNNELIAKFLEFCKATGIGERRLDKYIYSLPKISEWLGKPFKEVTRDDMIKMVAGLEEKDYANWTKVTYKAIIKRFWKWLNGDEDYPDCVRWIRGGLKNGNKKLPENLLTPEEIDRLVDVATNIRDKAFVRCLYESGCRISELLNLQIKNVQFDEYSPIIVVSGKTGSRRIRLIDKDGLLKTWLKAHPFRDDPEGFVFVSMAVNRKNNPIEYHAVVKILRMLKAKSGITKEVNPHNFRHSRATNLAVKLTEAQMKQMFGWTQSSDMASVYVHLSGRDIDDALLRTSGLLDKEMEKKEKIIDKFDNLLATDSEFRSKIAKLLMEKGVKV